MTTQTQTIAKSIDPPDSTKTYVLHYIHGGHQVKDKFFTFSGPRDQAIARGKRHCELMNYRFIRVDEFMSDLVADEKKALGQ